MPGKMFGYGAFKQLKEMIPVFIATGIMALFVFTANSFIEILWFKLLAGISIGLSSYLLICYFLKLKELFELKSLVINLLNKHK